MLGIEALWIVPETASRPPHILIEPFGGPKAYIRVWTTKRDGPYADSLPIREWTWYRPDDAIKIG